MIKIYFCMFNINNNFMYFGCSWLSTKYLSSILVNYLIQDLVIYNNNFEKFRILEKILK